jgi:hypothetical protein
MNPMARNLSLADRVTDMLSDQRAAFDTKALNFHRPSSENALSAA